MSQPLSKVPVTLPPPRPVRRLQRTFGNISAPSSIMCPTTPIAPTGTAIRKRRPRIPNYMVPGVWMMSPTFQHGECIAQISIALKILTRRRAAPLYVSDDVQISGISAVCFKAERHTASLRPNLSLRPTPRPMWWRWYPTRTWNSRTTTGDSRWPPTPAWASGNTGSWISVGPLFSGVTGWIRNPPLRIPG